MAEAALRKLDRDLPRHDMRSPALIARQQAGQRSTLLRLRTAEAAEKESMSKAERAAAGIIRDARREAGRMVVAANAAIEKRLSEAGIEAARIVAEAHHAASAILAAAEAGKAVKSPAMPVSAIILAVAKRFGVSPLDITGPSRALPIVLARRAAMVEVYLTRLDLSTPKIGREFGGRDHTTVLHAIRKAGVYRGERKA